MHAPQVHPTAATEDPSSLFAAQPTGRARLHPIPNTANAMRLGLNLAPIQILEGDFSVIDQSKLKRKLTSGRYSSGTLGVIREERWPHQCLSDAAGRPPKEASALTHHQFTAGMLGKILSETPPNHIAQAAENKMMFTSRVSNLAFTVPWSQLVDVVSSFFEAIEQCQQSWDDWPAIDSWLQNRERLLRVMPANAKRDPPPTIPGDPGHDHPPSKKSKGEDVLGVPLWWLKVEQICVFFSRGSCKSNGDHPSAREGTPLSHICGACHRDGKGRISAHGISTCPNKGPSKSFEHLF